MNKALKTTIYKLVPAVLISLIATSLGLLSLLQSKVPMIEDFGIMLTIGIVIAFILAILVLLPILTIRTKMVKPKNNELKKRKPSTYVKVMKKITKQVLKAKYIILIVAILLAALGFYFDQKVGVETDMEAFMPQDSAALADINELRDLIGSTDRIVIMYEADDIDDYTTLSQVNSISNMVLNDYQDSIILVGSVTSMLNTVTNSSWDESNYQTYLNQLPSEQLALVQSTEENLGIINISLTDMTDVEFETFITNLNTSLEALDLDLGITITGQSIVDQEMLSNMTSDRLLITLISIALVFVVLLIIYRDIFKALIAILPIIIIVGWSGGVMYLLGFDYTPLTSTLGALIIGIGTEFTILILMRYFEFVKTTKEREGSIINAVSIMSKPIIVSAITTIGGFSALVFSDFQILSNFGIMTLINILLALISALVVLPALLGLMGNKVKVRV